MKISQLTAEQGLEVIANILIPIANIAEDKEAMTILAGMQPEEGEIPIQTVARAIKSGLVPLIKNHKSDLVKILAAVNCKTTEEYSREAGVLTLAKDIYDLVTDEDLKYFFCSAQKTEEGESSGSAPDLTPVKPLMD